jgi:hypothetical protein
MPSGLTGLKIDKKKNFAAPPVQIVNLSPLVLWRENSLVRNRNLSDCCNLSTIYPQPTGLERACETHLGSSNTRLDRLGEAVGRDQTAVLRLEPHPPMP